MPSFFRFLAFADMLLQLLLLLVLRRGIAQTTAAADAYAAASGASFIPMWQYAGPNEVKRSGAFFVAERCRFSWRVARGRRGGGWGVPKRYLNMKIRVGIVGLPNVGKSTLFNALARKSLAQAANFPFCTIDPNVAPVAIPDPYLERLGTLAGSEKCTPATVEWVDVAGLTRNAHRGEGLGNRFLATVRECHAVCHVVRTFEDANVVHVDGRVNPGEDAEVVNLELLLADLAHVERRLDRSTCDGEEREALEVVKAGLERGLPARALGLTDGAKLALKGMGLLTLKPVLYALNVDEVDFALGRDDALAHAREVLAEIYSRSGSDGTADHQNGKECFALVSAKIEEELSSLSTDEERRDFLASLGMEEDDTRHLDQLLSCIALPLAVQRLLGLSLAYTGPGVPRERSRTTKAHAFRRGRGVCSGGSDFLTADGLAGRLHGDIQRGFIRAEVVDAPTLLKHSSYADAKDAGCVRTEGRDYILNDEDVVLIKWK